MRYVYPATVEQDEDGQLIVSFRDVPEALTSGRTLDEALAEAVDCQVVTLDGYVDDRRPRPIPRPSRVRSGGTTRSRCHPSWQPSWRSTTPCETLAWHRRRSRPASA